MGFKKSYLILDLVVVIILVLSVVAYFTRKPATEPSSEPKVANNLKPMTGPVTVTYDSNGFVPKDIVVAKGTTVSFDNKTEIPMWVASDSHPEHLDYPEFDVIRVNGQYPEPGNDYSFTFDKPGVWTYHNHTMPGDIGRVTVQ